jgi:hypothetical protein
MDYSEAKYQALKDEKQIAKHAIQGSGRKTVNEFAYIYSRSLEQYLRLQFKNNEKVHIEDLAVNAAAFSEAFYIIVGELY